MPIAELLIACLMQATESGRVRWRQGFSEDRYVAVLENAALRIERDGRRVTLTFLDGRGVPRLEFVERSADSGTPLAALFRLARTTERFRRQAVEELAAALEK